MRDTTAWTVAEWQKAYREGLLPGDVLPALLATLDARDPAWIAITSPEALAADLDRLQQRLAAVGGDLACLPLYGVPFAVKDNIDSAGLPTTCACPAFAYTPAEDAAVVARLRDAGAIVMGKTNLDQFATGLVGTRSPYGIVRNSFNPEYISGGSSSGSASVVARGLVPFALGTDTAGSGRVPAGFNNIVGLKPTVGLFSTRGVVPACRTLDCVSIFALTVADADFLREIAEGYDAADPFSRARHDARALLPAHPVFGIPAAPEWFGDARAQAAWEHALAALAAMGVMFKPIDFSVMHDTTALLYDGPWVAERYAAIEGMLQTNPEALNPVVRRIIDRARGMGAVDAFRGQYRRAELARAAARLMAGVDALLVPTTPTIYRVDEVEAEPVLLNSRLGTWTNYVNLLDWCALALPAGLRSDGLPFGVTLIAPAFHDQALARFGQRWEDVMPWRLGASGRAPEPLPLVRKPPMPADTSITVAVVGAHLSGMPLNDQLTERGATLLEATTTAATYRLYALPDTVPPKPGLKRVAEGGEEIAIELWSMPVEHFGSFVGLIPSPLGIGTLETADGRLVKGFICEPWALEGARDITAYGGWRAYIASLK